MGEFFTWGPSHMAVDADTMDAIADDLKELSGVYRRRAAVLRDTRRNAFCISDRLQNFHAAKRTYERVRLGQDMSAAIRWGANFFRTDAKQLRFMVNRLKRRDEKARRQKRNNAIIKQARRNVPAREIGRRFGIGKSQVSRIVARAKGNA